MADFRSRTRRIGPIPIWRKVGVALVVLMLILVALQVIARQRANTSAMPPTADTSTPLRFRAEAHVLSLWLSEREAFLAGLADDVLLVTIVPALGESEGPEVSEHIRQGITAAAAAWEEELAAFARVGSADTVLLEEQEGRVMLRLTARRENEAGESVAVFEMLATLHFTPDGLIAEERLEIIPVPVLP